MKKILTVLTLTATSLFVFSTAVFAAPIEKLQISQPEGALTDINQILGASIQLILIVAGLIAFVFLLLGGIKWITSGGDKGQVEAARNQIIQALIGLMVVLAAWGVIVLVESLTGTGLGFSKSLTLPKFYGEQQTLRQCNNGMGATDCSCPGTVVDNICNY